ncbi:hypothetical protein HHK36_015219 [Tetracentron sinense]|uniref:Response regulatory domain-containing protein n=1 Tax=Tetracentron sinense TaxID=13715 RepID=A0A834Z0E7_TETSI|nr:hypothetical protein HHK36_015219 [Tetracentron sinense]
MARNGVFSRKNRSAKVETLDAISVDSHELHVLAVDDSLVDRKVIERILKISSCKVTAVDSGRRALQFLGLDGERSSSGFDGLKVDMIITDYCMPGMTGYELLKKIKESSTFREIPVVIMSSENVMARIDRVLYSGNNRCLEEGAEEFIVKPVKLSDVKRLKDYVMREEGEDDSEKGTYKRKLQQDDSDLSSLSSSSSSSSPSSSPPSSSSSSPLSSPSRQLKTTSTV